MKNKDALMDSITSSMDRELARDINATITKLQKSAGKECEHLRSELKKNEEIVKFIQNTFVEPDPEADRKWTPLTKDIYPKLELNELYFIRYKDCRGSEYPVILAICRWLDAGGWKRIAGDQDFSGKMEIFI